MIFLFLRHKREGYIKDYSAQLEEIGQTQILIFFSSIHHCKPFYSEEENQAGVAKNQALREKIDMIKNKFSKLDEYWQGKRENRR